MDIHISGFTKRQRLFADILWKLESMRQVEIFIDSLRGKDRKDALLVLSMIQATALDEVTDTDLANSVLKKFML